MDVPHPLLVAIYGRRNSKYVGAIGILRWENCSRRCSELMNQKDYRLDFMDDGTTHLMAFNTPRSGQASLHSVTYIAAGPSHR